MARFLCFGGIFALLLMYTCYGSSLHGIVVQQASDVYETVVQQAIDVLVQEENSLDVRKLDGVDRTVPEFADIGPTMLGAHRLKQLLIPRETIRRCKLINRIHSMVSLNRMSENITDFLRTQTAKDHDIYCPFSEIGCGLMPGRFRSYSGRCNNRKHPLWGAAFTPADRDLPPVYESGELAGVLHSDLPRRHGINGVPLPSTRLISNIVHPPSDAPVGTTTTSLYTAFGQTLSHDITDTPLETGTSDSKFGCCNQTIPTSRCFNIDIPEDDDFFHSFGRTCMGFTRSAEITGLSCTSGRREQMNIVSSFIDVTQIYGHSSEHVHQLRDEDGLLKMSDPDHLPMQAHPNAKALRHGINFLMSGDEKVGEFPGLVGVTTLLQREHNRVAKKLFKLKKNFFSGPSYYNNGEMTFLHARKILIAMTQHIVYNEYLPVTLGPEYMVKYGLKPIESGYYEGYDPEVNPSLTNVVGTAAMRFGHSMVRNTYSVMDKSYISKVATLQLKKIYWRDNFYLLFENGFQRGVLVDDSDKCDRHMAVDLKDHMFETKPGNGLDLAAFNIQRGRDHGLPSYNEYRRLVSLSPALEWSNDKSKGFSDMSIDVVNRLKMVYDSPEDVDVWTGGVSEIPVPGGQVGPLFAELLGRQFQKLRKGDYYWYENVSNGFTMEQLSEIRKYSLAKMMCNNFPITKIQPLAFQLSSVPGNARVACDSIPDINLYAW